MNGETLLDLQRSFARGLLRASPNHDGRSDGYNIHARNVRVSLVRAIADTFPVTADLLGRARFASLAGEFAAAHPPGKGWLSVYGEEFPAFLSRLSLKGAPDRVPEVALLEWTRVEVSRAEIPPALDLADLVALDATEVAGARLTVPPCAILLDISRQALALWEMWQQPKPRSAFVRTDDIGYEQLLVIRSGMRTTRHVAIDRADAALLRAFKRGSRLDQAVAAAVAVNPSFDLSAALLDLANIGALARIDNRGG